MSRYFKYHHLGGIIAEGASRNLATGIAIHSGLAHLVKARGFPADDAVEVALEDLHKESTGIDNLDEQERLVEGLVRIWAELMLDPILSAHDVMSVEQEYPFHMGDVLVTTRPDLVLRNKAGEILVIDYKSVSTPSEDWASRTALSMQFMMMQHALELAGFKDVKFVLHGLVKGSYKGKWNPRARKEEGPKQQQSSLCYAFRQLGNPPFGCDVWEPEEWYQTKFGNPRKLDSSFERRPTSEYPGGVKEWVGRLKELGQLGKFIVVTEPFNFGKQQVEQAIRSLEGHESDWESKLELLERDFSWERVDKLFPRSYACHNFDGTTCQFKPICFRENDLWKSPLESGKFKTRQTAGTVANQ